MEKRTTIRTHQDLPAIAGLNNVMIHAATAANQEAARVAFQDHTVPKIE